MQKILAAALAASFAATTAFAGGMDAAETDGDVQNDNDNTFIAAPSLGLLGGGAAAAAAVGALALAVALSADDENDSSGTTTTASN